MAYKIVDKKVVHISLTPKEYIKGKK